MPPSTSHADDALELLAEDHAHVREAFDAYDELVDDEARPEHRKAHALSICDALTAHTAAEAAVFYPAVRRALGEDDPIDEAEAEHAAIEDLIDQVRRMDATDDRFDGTVAVLAEMVRRHVLEEEGELFPLLEELEFDRVRLAEQIAAVRDETLADLQSQALDAERPV